MIALIRFCLCLPFLLIGLASIRLCLWVGGEPMHDVWREAMA